MKAFYFYLILFAGIFFGCHVLEAQNVATGKDTVKAEYSGEKPILIFDSMRMMDSMPFSPMQISTSTLNSWLSFNVDRIFPPLSAVFQPPAPSPMSFFGWSSEFRYSRSSMTGILFNLTPRLSLSSSAALGLTDAPLTLLVQPLHDCFHCFGIDRCTVDRRKRKFLLGKCWGYV